MTFDVGLDLVDTIAGSWEVIGDAEVSSESCDQYFCILCSCFLLEVIQKLNTLLPFINSKVLVRDTKAYLTSFNRLVGSIFFWKRLTNSL